MINEKLANIHELQAVAKELRERQEIIEAKMRGLYGSISDLIGDGIDQGKAIKLAKTKLGKYLKWSDWLGAHVPNLTESQASKYERLAAEGIDDPRQAMFAFLPPANPSDAKPEKPKPFIWQVACGHLFQFNRQLDTIKDWPDEQVENAKCRVSRAVEALGGRVEW